MHEALLPILLISYLPVAWRRNATTRALAVVATAVSALLLPVLLRPGFVPSPSAILGQVVPWTAVLEPSAGNPHLVDITFQVEPWLRFLRDELRAGRAPYWDPFQFSGEPFWSNGSSAPLFPLHLLFAALPLATGFTLLPWLRLVVGGMGAWALARELGVGERPAWLAGVIYPLSGMIVSWMLYPMGNAHPLVPWVFWALERWLRGASSWRPLAAIAGLQLLAGHPETPAFTAFLGGIYLLARGRRVVLAARTWIAYAAAWTVGLAVAAVQLVPLIHTILASSKLHEHALPTPVPISTKLALLSRFLLPDLFGRAGSGTWWGPFNDPATAVYAGALALPLAALAHARVRRDPRWRALAVMGAVALVAAYHLFGSAALLVRLPVLGLGLHHYMKFAVELALAVLAAAGLESLAREPSRRLPWIVAGAVALWAVGLGAAFADDWERAGSSARAAAGLGWAVAAAFGVALLASLRLRRRAATATVVLLVAVAAVDLARAHRPAVPALAVDELHPRTPAVAALQELAASGGRVAGVGAAFRPDAAMVFRVPDVRGDSPLKLRSYEAAYAEMAAPHPWLFQPIRDWDHPWLDRLGVRWVMGAAGEAPPRSDWRVAWADGTATIWERPGAQRLVRWAAGTPGGRIFRVIAREPGAWTVEVGPGPPGTLEIAETWDAGWRARWRGRPLPVVAEGGLLLGIRVPEGPGRLHLSYRPWGLAWGTALSIAGLLILVPWGRRGDGRGRPAPPPDTLPP